jgi:hypothetical protein
MKSKRIAKVACAVVCALILLAVLFNGTGSTQFVIAPKNWGLSMRQLEIGTVYTTNGVAENFTNRVSHIGPVIFTEFNR